MPESPEASTACETVRVPLGDRAYDIVIAEGLIDRLGAELAPVLKRQKVFIVTDTKVAEAHLGRALAALDHAGITAEVVVLPSGEATKSYGTFTELLDRLLGLGAERKDILVALGGGVIGDITGFAASVLRRGMDFVQVPTTLLAQVDSSVGGKTGINSPFGKNLIGAFHQPRKVIADLTALDTLSARELRAGYAEVVKYGLIDDLPFFEWLEDAGPAILAGNRTAQARAVAHSCAAKARIVGEDERETGDRRALLNLGHTFGHALEAECGYDGTLLHGEAVAIGMGMALDASVRLGLAPEADKVRYLAHLAKVGMKARAADIGRSFDVDKLIGHMAQDKKVDAGKLTFILGPIGGARIVQNPDLAAIRASLEDSLA
ncbi:3-dehydroquinate synthase [Gimibacter soli]|uniref:3-dehydroquinate synthase n=1 Tax=Gimibacter soli TaxID=3024400 RepID=A0AAE9XNC1_9PROT|nr:3-dehydroquinate synthase [Gimibacter soli]WCL54177.1 3-dehydroquinate synthase [Gimibacter soli]